MTKTTKKWLSIFIVLCVSLSFSIPSHAGPSKKTKRKKRYRQPSVTKRVQEKKTVRKSPVITLPKLDAVTSNTSNQLSLASSEGSVKTQVITQEDIKIQGALNLQEALQYQPGIIIQQNSILSNHSSLSMMGIHNSSKLLIDGIPLTNESWNSYGLQQFPASNIERIEIIRGNTSAAFGNNYSTGIINVITKRPQENTTLSTAILAETNTIAATAFAGQRKDNIGYSIQTQKTRHSAEDINNDDITDSKESDITAMNGKLYFYESLGKESELVLNVNVANETRKAGSTGTLRQAINSTTEQVRTNETSIGTSFKKAVQNGGTLFGSVSKTDLQRDTQNGTVTSTDTETPGYNVQNDKWIYNLSFATPIYNDHFLLMGVDRSTEEVDEFIHGENGVKKGTNLGIYIQDEWHISKQTLTTLSIRFDRNDMEDSKSDSSFHNNFFSPRASVQHKVNSKLTTRASFGTSFKTPSLFSEEHHLFGEFPSIFISNNIKPESVSQLTMGLDYRQNEIHSYYGNLFFTAINDKLDTKRSDQVQFDIEWFNAGEASSNGIEIGSSHQVNEFHNISTNLTVTNAKLNKALEPTLDNSDKLLKTPELTSKVTFSVRAPKHDIRYLMDVNYIGQMYVGHDTNQNGEFNLIKQTQPYFIVNTGIRKDFEMNNTQTLGLSVGIKNLFNYVQTDIDVNDTNYVYAPLSGQHYYMGLSLDI